MITIFSLLLLSGFANPNTSNCDPIQFYDAEGGTQISWAPSQDADLYSIDIESDSVSSDGTAGVVHRVVSEPKCVIGNFETFGDRVVTIRALTLDLDVLSGDESQVMTEVAMVGVVNHTFQGNIERVTGDGAYFGQSVGWLFPAAGGSHGTGCLVAFNLNGTAHVVVNFPPKPSVEADVVWHPVGKVCVRSDNKIVGICDLGGKTGRGGLFVWDPSQGEGGFQYYAKNPVSDICQGLGGRVFACCPDLAPTATTNDSGIVAEVLPNVIGQLDQFPLLVFDSTTQMLEGRDYGIRPRYVGLRGTKLQVVCGERSDGEGGSIVTYSYNGNTFDFQQYTPLPGNVEIATEPGVINLTEAFPKLTMTRKSGLSSLTSDQNGLLASGGATLPNAEILAVMADLPINLAAPTDPPIYILRSNDGTLYQHTVALGSSGIQPLVNGSGSAYTYTERSVPHAFTADLFSSPLGWPLISGYSPGLLALDSGASKPTFLYAPQGWKASTSSRTVYTVH